MTNDSTRSEHVDLPIQTEPSERQVQHVSADVAPELFG